MYKIVASRTFKLCLDRLVHFLTRKYSAEFAQQIKQTIKKAILENLSSNPFVAPVSERLVELGIKEYRQCLIEEHNIVFYRVDKNEKKVVLLAVMDSRQSIQKLLSEIMLLS